MFDAWKKRRAEAHQKRAADRAAKEAVERDEYLQRLDTSAQCLCGLSHSTHSPTLSIYEVQSILRREYNRLVTEATTNDR